VPTPHDSSLELPLATRLWFAWVCLFRVLFDPLFAHRVWALRMGPKTLPGPADPDPQGRNAATIAAVSDEPPSDSGPSDARADTTKGLQLLALLQREGRLIDFLEQDVTRFTDEEVGAAARLVHEGCRKVLRRVTSVAPLRPENEGTNVVIAEGFSPAEITLVGNVRGSAPYRGTLRHRGWRASDLHLPEVTQGHDAFVLAPAEIEL
jgi:Domain of unknown function (DUF2760)